MHNGNFWAHFKNILTKLVYIWSRKWWVQTLKKCIYVTGFAKKVLYMHSFKEHLLSPFDSYMNGPTAHVFNTTENQTVCFHSGLFSSLSDVHRCSGGIQMALSFLDKQTADWLMTWMADEFGLGFSCFVWHMEVKMAPMEVIWLFLVWRCSLYAPLVAPCLPLTVPAYRSADGIGYTSKKLSKMAGNSTGYPVYSRHGDLPWIAIDLWRNMCR